jgi:tetratricopeptide (TPR) repeat protein
MDYADATHYNLGLALAKKGHLDEAIADYHEALRLMTDRALVHTTLGGFLVRKGQLDEAIDECREAIRLWRNHVDSWQTPCQEAEAHSNLAKALRYKGRLGDAFVEDKEAFRLYSTTIADKPQVVEGLITNQVRYDAACASARAGCYQGADADKLNKECPRLRQQALDWLRADLKAYRQMLEKSADKSGPMIVQRMQHWLQDPDFDGVRGPEALARLPEAEHAAWQKLWDDVAQMLAKAQGKAPAVKKPDTK